MIVRYIKQSSDNFTYGKIYQVVGYWGKFNDYTLLDKNKKRVEEYKHFFEDVEIKKSNTNKNREIDRLIIKHLNFDLHSETERGFWVYFPNDQDATLFRPSENIQDAWLVVEKFDEVDITKEFQGTYECRIFAFDNNGKPIECWARFGDTAPMAICKASLYALGVEYNIFVEDDE